MRGTVIKLRASGTETHLWFVVSNPDQATNRVLAFNLTDFANYPSSRCVLEIGDHPRITMRSSVRYFSPKIWDATVLQKQIAAGIFEQFQNASEAVISKIISGAYEDDTPEICFNYLPPRPA
jgi:hypothetical protein